LAFSNATIDYNLIPKYSEIVNTLCTETITKEARGGGGNRKCCVTVYNHSEG